MEKLIQESQHESFDPKFYQSITEKFNLASGCVGKNPIHWEQVKCWFQSKRQTPKDRDTSLPDPSNEVIVLDDSPVKNMHESSAVAPISVDKVSDLSELEFEARSAKDGAWYDVALFLTHRILHSGEPEVRVRFTGFGAEEDEWVNVKRAVRRRSIPLESSECGKVMPGDLVLCFREGENLATYFDAHVIEVQRRRHDLRGCRCTFLVRYDHDQAEERVRLRRVCRRPS
ncbi:hypothetical protein AMTR_s00056p00105160 [Amborella trichopoda]|uniref:SAWADEE domain-containing protein n=2 Tax=Amborella trichopoda TaxID=13333 RepID=U5D165_AMBTC|nr:hypothetical protein AMTR_s00056p00105160 [Amborella trichopoda]